MAELTSIVATTAMPRKRYNHDCVDTGADLTLLDGVGILYPCNCSARDYKVGGKNIWISADSVLKDAVDDGSIWAEFNCTVNGNINTEIQFVFTIPNTILGDIPVKTIISRVLRNNVDDPIQFTTLLYNATDSDAKTYGFKVGIKAVGGNVTLKARSVLAITG